MMNGSLGKLFVIMEDSGGIEELEDSRAGQLQVFNGRAKREGEVRAATGRR